MHNYRATKISILQLAVIFSIALIPFACAESFLCSPWANSNTGEEIGESFISKIEDGTISFHGDKRPVSFAQTIYSHPLNDIFIAASGELVTAGLNGHQMTVSVFFPSAINARHFVRTTCNKI